MLAGGMAAGFQIHAETGRWPALGNWSHWGSETIPGSISESGGAVHLVRIGGFSQQLKAMLHSLGVFREIWMRSAEVDGGSDTLNALAVPQWLNSERWSFGRDKCSLTPHPFLRPARVR